MPRPFILVKRTVIAAAAGLAILYAGDALFVRFRLTHPTPTDPLESITAPRLYAIPQKSGKIDYEIDQRQPEQTVVCVHSLFPHYGYSPCWYLKRKIQQPIPMTIFPPLGLPIDDLRFRSVRTRSDEFFLGYPRRAFRNCDFFEIRPLIPGESIAPSPRDAYNRPAQAFCQVNIGRSFS
jgi:hypothetical protein